MAKSRAKGSAVASLAVDAASFVFSQWIDAGQKSPQYAYWDLQVDLGTSTTIAAHFATGSLGTGVYGTTTLLSSGNFTAGQLIGLTMLAAASTFVNFQPAATTTFRVFQINERYDW